MMVNVFFSLIAYPFLDVAALMDLLYISRSSAVRPTLHSQVHHNVITSFFGLPLFLWHCTFPSSINFFNGWFRLHVRNNLFCLFNEVPDLTTAMDWFGVCSVHDTQTISRYHLFSNAFMRFSMFCSGSTFHVHVAVENMHVHNALLLLFVAFHSLSIFIIFLNDIANLRMILFYLRQLLSMTQYILNYSPFLFLHKLL